MDHEGIMIDKLDELTHKHSLKMIFINPIFHNPTGKVMSPMRKKIFSIIASESGF